MNLASRRLAARAGTRQLDALHACNGIAGRVDALVGQHWRQMLRLLKAEDKRRAIGRQFTVSPEFLRQVTALIRRMQADTYTRLHRDFMGLARWGHRSAAQVLGQSLPVSYLRSAANERVSQGLSLSWKPHTRTLGEASGTRENGPGLMARQSDRAVHRPFPDVRQSAEFSCGAAALLAICRFFGVGPKSEHELQRIAKTDPADGTSVLDLTAAARAVGLNVRRLTGVKQLVAFLRAGWPVVCPIQQGEPAAKATEQAGHYVVALQAGRRFVRIHDPLQGRRWVRWLDFLADWHDHDADGRRYVHFGLAFSRRAPAGQRLELIEDDQKSPDPGPILLKLGLGGQLQATDRLGRLREPVRDELSDDQQRDLLQSLLFPPLSLDRIVAILRHPVAGLSWEQDLAQATKLADPNVVAGIIAGGFAAGKNHAEVAKLLLPAVGNVKSTARRVARTYGMQIAHRAQMDAHAAVDDLIVGYQVHALLDQHTRPWHAHRSGRIYYKHPEPGQDGMEKLPHPPAESMDLGERPPGTPRVAPN